MDQVQAVELGYGTDRSGKAKIREDLVKGFWADPEDIFDGVNLEQVENTSIDEDMARGRELLHWARGKVVDGQYVFVGGSARK
jgi:hypothetical protein